MKLMLTVESSGDLISDVTERIENPEPLLRSLADLVREREQDAFASRGFGTWAPLNPATVEAKGSARVLVDHGGLLASATKPGDRYAVEKVTDDEVIVGSRNPVAGLMRKGPRGIPQRNPYPPTTTEERATWARATGVWAVEGRTL